MQIDHKRLDYLSDTGIFESSIAKNAVRGVIAAEAQSARGRDRQQNARCGLIAAKAAPTKTNRPAVAAIIDLLNAD